MTETFISLTIIAFVSAVTPLIARVIPRQVVPETVILIAAGAILGPNTLGIIHSNSEALKLLSELGCAFLFLLAGFEIDPKVLIGKEGKKGFSTWMVTFIIGLAVAFLLPDIASGKQGMIATALLFTTTALGTLMPILEERGLTGTRVGSQILAYGTWGELATVIAMAILLSTRRTWKTALILGALLLICLWVAHLGNRAVKGGSAIYRFIESKSETTSQLMLRITILIMIMLVAFSSVFDLDIVLGAFAAGFVLRYILPEENNTLESKLNGLAHGFLIPLFFIISGAGINPASVTKNPGLLLIFIIALLLVRAIPIVISLSLEKDVEKRLSLHNRFSVAFYCTTALPLIVGITGIAVNEGFMTSDIASVLIAAGAVSVFLMPYLGAATYSVVDSEPLTAVKEIIHSPREMSHIIQKHIELERKRAKQYRDFAAEKINSRVDAIDNPDERREMRKLIQQQRNEDLAFRQKMIHRRKKLWRKHRTELQAVYQKYHNGNIPEDNLIKSLEQESHR